MESEEAVETLPAWKNGEDLGEVDIFRRRSSNPYNINSGRQSFNIAAARTDVALIPHLSLGGR